MANSEQNKNALEQLRSLLDENKQFLSSEQSERAASELEATEKSLEQRDIAAANSRLLSARNEIELALRSAAPNSAAKGDLEAALQSLSTITINSGKDASNATTTIDTARQSAAAAEGANLQATLSGAALGLSGLAAIISSPENAEIFNQFKNHVSSGWQEIKDADWITPQTAALTAQSLNLPNITANKNHKSPFITAS